MSPHDGGARVVAAGALLAGGALLSVLAVSWTGTAAWTGPAGRLPDVPVVAGPSVQAEDVATDGSAEPGPGPTGAVAHVDDDTAGVAPTAAPVPVAATDWVEHVAGATGIPSVAMQAYADATLATQAAEPACHLGWSTLAALGAVESGHGTHGGTSLLPDGRTAVPVLGPALDGTHGTRAVPATADGAAWHGDTVWEHAVGPLQFLPSTWRQWGADADGDGAADPNDIQDAA